MKRQEAQSNSVAERRGWKQLRARKAADSESELDSADTTVRACWERAKPSVCNADGMTTLTLHGNGWSQKRDWWLEIGCLPKWLRVTRDTQAAQSRSSCSRAKGAEEPRRLGVRASIVAQATPGDREKNAPARRRRRVTTAGAKGRRKMDA